MKNLLKRTAMLWRFRDRQLYSQVAEELQVGKVDSGLWAKAYANAGGDKQKSEALYIKYRARSLLDEYEISQASEASHSQKQNNPDTPQADKSHRGKTHQCSKCGGIAEPTWGSSKRAYNICKKCFYGGR